jgi:cell division protein FtsB
MRALIVILLVLIIIVQYRIWVGKDSLVDVWQLDRAVSAQREENQRLKLRNQQLAAEVRDLKDGLAAVEARAREELGLVRKGETLYRFSDR